MIGTTILPILFISNIFVSSALHKIEEELSIYENSILSLWEAYIAARRAEGTPDWELPPPLPFQSGYLLLSLLEFHIPRWRDLETELSAFRTFIAKQDNPDDQIGAKNFEWFLADLQKSKTNMRKMQVDDRKWELAKRFRERKFAPFSFLERIAVYLEKGDLPNYAFLVAAFFYIVFRLLIIILSFISLRAMPDTVYDTTWAKNIPSVQ